MQHPIPFDKLHDELAYLGSKLLHETISDLCRYQQDAIVQDETLVTKAPKITPIQAKIDWNRKNARDIFILFLAIGSKLNLHAIFRNKKIQLTEIIDPSTHTYPNDLADNSIPGSLVFKNKLLYVRTNCDWLAVKRVRVEGKKEVDTWDFFNGYRFNNYQEFFS